MNQLKEIYTKQREELLKLRKKLTVESLNNGISTLDILKQQIQHYETAKKAIAWYPLFSTIPEVYRGGCPPYQRCRCYSKCPKPNIVFTRCNQQNQLYCMIMSKPSSPITPPARNRIFLIASLLVVIGLGLASRRYPFMFPAALGKYPGDGLWSIMVYLGWAIFKPKVRSSRIAIYALITCYLDEFSQLIQVSCLNSIRHTVWGHLILGTVFSGYDILSYTIGIIIAYFIERAIITRNCVK